MSKWTVIGFYESNGKTVCLHVDASNDMHSFYVAAQKDRDLTFVVSLPGHISFDAGMGFPGEGVVDAETILEQADIFGSDAVDAEAASDATSKTQKEIVIQVSHDYVPTDGDQFDAVQAALEHFEIPATLIEREHGSAPRIVIGVEGGVLRGATADSPVDYVVYDYDIEGTSNDQLSSMPALDGGEVEVITPGVCSAEVDSAKIAEIFAAVLADN